MDIKKTGCEDISLTEMACRALCFDISSVKSLH
jgi:hypothetical protein